MKTEVQGKDITSDTKPPSRSTKDIETVVIQRIKTNALMGGAQKLIIEHAGQEYYLRITKQGKLILTK